MSKKTPGRKSWLHPPNLLTEGHVVYQVKLLGNITVPSPKGADVVKEAIRKVKVQRAEGTKPRKVEVTVSHLALGIQEKQSKISLHSFPLQHISYCADDKSDKKICAFIARNDLSQTHECFVLESEKSQAEDITLTVGQAFDLAYQKYKETINSDPSSAMKKLKQFQQKITTLEAENKNLRARVTELEEKLGIESTLDNEEEKKERTSSTSSNTSQPFVFQLESFGGTSSTDPLDHGDDMANIFGPPLENIAETNGTTNHNSSQQNGNGAIFEDSFNLTQSPRSVDLSSSKTESTPVLAPPPRPTRQKRRQPPPSLLGVSSPNNNEIKTTPAVIPAAVSTNPFQDQGDWTKSLASPPPTVASGDLIFDPQQPKATKELTFDDLDPFAS